MGEDLREASGFDIFRRLCRIDNGEITYLPIEFVAKSEKDWADGNYVIRHSYERGLDIASLSNTDATRSSSDASVTNSGQSVSVNPLGYVLLPYDSKWGEGTVIAHGRESCYATDSNPTTLRIKETAKAGQDYCTAKEQKGRIPIEVDHAIDLTKPVTGSFIHTTFRCQPDQIQVTDKYWFKVGREGKYPVYFLWDDLINPKETTFTTDVCLVLRENPSEDFDPKQDKHIAFSGVDVASLDLKPEEPVAGADVKHILYHCMGGPLQDWCSGDSETKTGYILIPSLKEVKKGTVNVDWGTRIDLYNGWFKPTMLAEPQKSEDQHPEAPPKPEDIKRTYLPRPRDDMQRDPLPAEFVEKANQRVYSAKPLFFTYPVDKPQNLAVRIKEHLDKNKPLTLDETPFINRMEELRKASSKIPTKIAVVVDGDRGRPGGGLSDGFGLDEKALNTVEGSGSEESIVRNVMASGGCDWTKSDEVCQRYFNSLFTEKEGFIETPLWGLRRVRKTWPNGETYQGVDYIQNPEPKV